jgi:hypothetical protein
MNPNVARFLRDGFAFWSVLALVALANGTLCAPLLVSLLGESAAQPASSIAYLVLVYPLIFLFFVFIDGSDRASSYWPWVRFGPP